MMSEKNPSENTNTSKKTESEKSAFNLSGIYVSSSFQDHDADWASALDKTNLEIREQSASRHNSNEADK